MILTITHLINEISSRGRIRTKSSMGMATAYKFEEMLLEGMTNIIQAEELCRTNEENNDNFPEFEKEDLAHHSLLEIQTYRKSWGN